MHVDRAGGNACHRRMREGEGRIGVEQGGQELVLEAAGAQGAPLVAQQVVIPEGSTPAGRGTRAGRGPGAGRPTRRGVRRRRSR